jgi:hypothetical protein
MNYRNRDLLDLAYELDCTAQIDGTCEGGKGEPAHSNQSIHGKGGALKAHDVFFASMCRACHREIDQGRKFTREEKFAIWQRAHESTMLQIFDLGLVKVIWATARRTA